MQRAKISEFIKTNFTLFIAICIILSIICAFSWTAQGCFHFAKVRFLSGFLGAICFASLFTWLCSQSKWLKIAVLTFLALLLVIDLYIFFEFKARLTSKVMLIIAQTNVSEASKFATHYISDLKGIAVIAISVLVISLITICANRFRNNAISVLDRISDRWIIATTAFLNLLSLLVVYIGFFTSLFFYQISFNTVEHLINSIKMYIEELPDQEQLESITESASASLSDGHDSPDYVVWVIGESFNKHHSPLYGYPLNTTPYLMQLRNSGDLIVYSDAVTPSSSTILVMNDIFSTHSAGDSVCWTDFPLSVTLLHKAGYRVALYDNQTTKIGEDVKHDMTNMWFFNSNIVSTASLDYRNEQLTAFDLDFCKSELHRLDMAPQSIHIFHLNGQHCPAQTEYPETFEGFSAKDYDWRKGISEQQKEEIAYYDTATLYNDRVLRAIIEKFADKDAIVIYHSDHGEEVHDYRYNYGRNFEAINKNIARNIFEIPMMVYTTPLFREKHNELYSSLLNAASKPFYLKNISHFILDICDIESQWYKPERSLLNDSYVCGARIINDEVDYDTLMK